jgi:hypothetical protein
MNWSATVIKLFICCVVTKWSPSTALHNFDERNGQENTQNDQLDEGKHPRQLRSSSIQRYSSQGERIIGHDVAAEQITRLNEPDENDIEFQQDLNQLKREHSKSSVLFGESRGHTFKDQDQDQSSIEVCRKMNLNFAKAANGRGMSGGEFVRGEWFHRYGVNIYAEGHDGKDTLHPMIFDSSHVESNGLGSNTDVFSLGSPNFDCMGFGVGKGGKEGKPGENCQALGNLLIPSPSRNPGLQNFNLNTKGRSDQPPLGGVLIFEFNTKTKVDSVGFLNIGDSDQIMVIYNDGSLEKIDLFSLGQNGFQNARLDLDDVNKLYINLHSFGAVTGLELCVVVD